METIAVYWEPKIKTYGLTEAFDLAMIVLKSGSDRMEEWSAVIEGADSHRIPFKFILIQYCGDHKLDICFLFERSRERLIMDYVDRFLDKNLNETVDIISPVEMICFFGPHFGDRYGIADAAVRVLQREGLSILAMGCSVSFVYIVLPEGTARPAKKLLAENFEIPS